MLLLKVWCFREADIVKKTSYVVMLSFSHDKFSIVEKVLEGN